MVGVSVLLADSEGGEHVFEGFAPSHEASRENDTNVSECRGGSAIFLG